MSDVAAAADKSWVYKPANQAFLVFIWLLFEKMVAHVYLVSLIYAGMPDIWSWSIAALVGLIGLWLVWRGLRHEDNEVRASWHGYMGGALIWTGALEMWHHAMGKYNMSAIAMKDGEAVFIPKFDTMASYDPYPFFMGEHAFLQSSTMFCLVLFFMMFANKDVRCRMILWFRRVLKMRPGKPTQGYKPQYSRVAATEMIFVNWFMYVVMLAVLDERTFGADHIVTKIVTAGIFLWAAFLIWQQLKQKETGLTIRYAIGSVGVFWFLPEMFTLWGWFKEPWVNFYDGSPAHNMNAILMLFITVAYIALSVIYYKTPVNPETGKSL